MIGPYDTWMVPRIGYAAGLDDTGGPMNLGEEYRLNVKTLYYAYDESFIQYFGPEGTNALEQAMAILNAIPAASSMSSNLSEFPLDVYRFNYQASALSLYDLKTVALQELVQYLGLNSPERFVWTLRARVASTTPPFTNYTVIKRNFDPVTLNPSSYVNGVLYTYQIIDQVLPNVSDAEEIQVDPLIYNYSVASKVVGAGLYATGLTRDDMGGLRRLYNPNLYHVETILPGTFTNSASGSGSPWGPPGGGGGTNDVAGDPVDQALRGGVDKVVFKQAYFDSLYGEFIAFTNSWTDTYVVNGQTKSQSVARAVTQPDIIFSAEDVGVSASGTPIFISVTTPNWINNDAINGSTTLSGPGIVDVPIEITFNKVGPWILNQWAGGPFFLTEVDGVLTTGFLWGSFDGTTNPPVVFPSGTSLQEYQNQIIYGGGGGGSVAWTIPDSLVVLTNGQTTDQTIGQ